MADLTRRRFLATGVATGAASIGTVALGSGLTAAALAAVGTTAAEEAAASSGDAVVAYVRDPRKGEVNVVIGHKEVAVRDPDLVGRLLRAAR